MIATGGSDDGTVKVTEIATGREVRSVNLGTGMVPAVEFDAKAKNVVVSGPGSALNAINVETGEVTVVNATIGYLPEYRFSADGRFMAARMSRGGGIVIWDAKTWKELRRIRSEAMADSSGYLGFSRDGRYVAAIDLEGRLRFWDPSTGADISTVGKGLASAGQVEFTHDGRVLAAAADGTIKVFGPSRAPALAPRGGGK
jgi:WD40 repeat protein